MADSDEGGSAPDMHLQPPMMYSALTHRSRRPSTGSTAPPASHSSTLPTSPDIFQHAAALHRAIHSEPSRFQYAPPSNSPPPFQQPAIVQAPMYRNPEPPPYMRERAPTPVWPSDRLAGQHGGGGPGPYTSISPVPAFHMPNGSYGAPPMPNGFGLNGHGPAQSHGNDLLSALQYLPPTSVLDWTLPSAFGAAFPASGPGTPGFVGQPLPPAPSFSPQPQPRPHPTTPRFSVSHPSSEARLEPIHPRVNSMPSSINPPVTSPPRPSTAPRVSDEAVPQAIKELQTILEDFVRLAAWGPR